MRFFPALFSLFVERQHNEYINCLSVISNLSFFTIILIGSQTVRAIRKLDHIETHAYSL